MDQVRPRSQSKGVICALRVLTTYFFFSPLVPFDEDDKDDSVWFLDHDYLENMYGMFKKVNGRWQCGIGVCVCKWTCVPPRPVLHIPLFFV